MAVGSVLANALSALQTSQTALSTTAANVANLNTPGYQRRVVEQQALQYGNTSGGVGVAEIRRIAATFLARESLNVTSATGRYQAEAEVHDSIQGLFGRPDENSSLSGRIDRVFATIQDLAVDPTSVIRRSTLLSDLNGATGNFADLFDRIQGLRFDVDQEVVATVAAINDALVRIDSLNPQIQSASAGGNGDANGLRDQRDLAVNQLSELMDIRVQEQPNGKLYVSTPDGVPLVTEHLFQLDYTPPGPVSSQTSFAPIVIRRVDENSGALVAQGTALEPHLKSGRLRGLLDMRGTVLPGLAKEIGELARNVADRLNAAHNGGTASPPPNSLSGRNTGLLGTDNYGFTGRSAFVVLGNAGNLVRRVDVDFDAGTYAINNGAPVAFGGNTVADMVSAINTGLGADGNLTFSNGVLTLGAALPANGVAVVDDAAAPSARGGRGFSHFFGLNDLVEASEPSFFDTGLRATDAHGFTPGQTFNLVLKGPDGQVAIDYTHTIAAGTVGDLITALNTAGTGLGGFVNFSLDANGRIAATPTAAFSGYRMEVADDTTSRGGTALSVSKLFGLGDSAQMDHARNMRMRSTIANSPDKLALAQVELTPTSVPGDAVLGRGDNRGALRLAAAQDQPVSFFKAGRLGALTTTLSSYAGSVLSDAGQLAAAADALHKDNETLKTDITERKQAIEGVNLDEELANMTLYQQSYNAAARLITTSNDIFNALLQAMGGA